MTISASQVKALRERTGAGMMECKKALQAADGDIDAAAENMRRDGLAKADKKAGRVAAEGRVVTAVSDDGSRALLLEVNSETDFVASNADFVAFAEQVAGAALAAGVEQAEALAELDVDGETVDARRRALVAKLGENISVRRVRCITADNGVIGAYLHGSRIGCLVALEGGDEALARDIAMHVAATNPEYASPEDVPEDVRQREKAFLIEQAQDSGKPDDIIEKMVEGRLRKYFAEITLLGQPFVKDPDQTVEKLLKAAGAKLLAYARFEVGEGIEKVEEDFAAEVRAQAQGSA